MKYLSAGISGEAKHPKALIGGTMAAAPISCVAGYHTICELEETNAPEKANEFGDKLIKGVNEIIDKYHLPFVAFNQGSICHVDTTGTMHFSIDWSKPWQIPGVLNETSRRKHEMEHIGAAYMAEGFVTLAGSRLYTSAAYEDDMLEDVLARFDKVFANCAEV